MFELPHRLRLVRAGQHLQRHPGQWAGCRGNGCAVCQEQLAGYDCYLEHHPRCALNTTCAGQFFTCNADCPQPTNADRCVPPTGAPPTAVRLTGFYDSGYSGNYYEIRQYFFNARGENVGYNPQKWDGDAMANGSFQPQVVAPSIPCLGSITVDIGRIGFFNSWTRVTPAFSVSAPGAYSFPNFADPYGIGAIAYSWNGCL